MSELPKGWVEDKVGKYIHLRNGYAFKSHDYVEPSKNTVPVIRISDIDGEWASDKKANHVAVDKAISGFEVVKNDLLVAMSGATTGKIGIYNGNEPALQNQRVGNFKLNAPEICNSSFRNYLVKYISPTLLEIAYGGAQPNISASAIEELVVSFPPLAEQKRIVEKLDEVLAHVDSIKARLDSIPNTLKRFRQSVLASAVSGKLTEEWREKHAFSWKESCIGSIALVATGKTPKRTEPSYWDTPDVPWLTSSATGILFCNEAEQYVSQFAVDDCKLKMFGKGTLLLAMYGEGKTRGQVTELTFEATCNQACAAITVNQELALISFVKLRLLENYEETRKSAAGGNQPNLNLNKVREIPVNLPSLEEQTEIVRLVDQYFAFADAIEKQVNNAQQRVDKLTQSILAKAFRGELVPQDPNDEPADKLLERIAKAKQDADALVKAAKKSVKKGGL
ncbi:restriction endonuclease subunit S [Marinomonas sp. 2405UD66-6]|uniref:restriction endonuclease subunit S n=1 Tax=Marinomonas sp. 2405UD66-6 TaxID=3391834 RepID=UPI0039C9A593